MKQRRIKEIVDADAKALAEFVDDAQFNRIIGAVYDVADGGFWHTAFDVKLVLRHAVFL